MLVRVKQLHRAVNNMVRKRLARLRTKRWFKPILLACAILLAICVVGVSYAALFNRNNIPDQSGSKHAASSDSNKSSASKSVPAGTPVQDYPGSLLNLTNWYLTLPIAKPGTSDPQTIKQPRLDSFALAPYFQLDNAHDGVVFQAPAGGATTKNSRYPRSELREMTNGGMEQASWSSTRGTNSMTIRQAITHVPSVKPHVVAGQIHDSSDDVIMIRLEGPVLFVEADGENIGTLDSNYVLGTVFTVQLIASDGHIQVIYNGAPRVDYKKSGSGYYFKAGCYTQSNPGKGDSPSAYGEVIIYDLQVSHS